MSQENVSHHHHNDGADPHNHKHTGTPERLQISDRFFEALDRQIIAWLKVAPGSRVLDAGCGGGGMTRLLAEAVGPDGQVVGLDANPELLQFGQAQVDNTELAGRIKFQEGDVLNLPFEAGSFELAWSSRVVHGLVDQLAGVRELRRVVRPGGRVVLREGGLGVQFMPFDVGIGQPGLDARLQSARQTWFANWRASLPDGIAYPFGWLQMLSEAGLSQVAAKSFMYEFASPLDLNQKAYLEDGLKHYLENEAARALLSAEDVQTIAQLTDRDGPHYLFNRADLYGVGVETIYVGYV